MRRNNFITSVWKKVWKKKVAILDCFLDIACILMIFMLVTPDMLNLDPIGELGDGDPRKEIALFLAASAGVIRLVVTVAAVTTAPGWTPVVAAVGTGVLFVSICLVAWDFFDGDDTGRFKSD